MPEPFGSFDWICSHTVLPQCNLFFSQLWGDSAPYLSTLFPPSSSFFDRYDITDQNVVDDPNAMAARSAAGTGVGSNCEIARAGRRGSIGDVALIVLSALSLLMAMVLATLATRRRAAVGRVEIRLLLVMYGLHSAFQIVTMSSVLEQASMALSILSSIHVAIVVALFWILLANALVATQIVEDGTPSAIVPMVVIAILFFGPTLYISLDTSLHWTSAFHMGARSIPDLKDITLFILTLIWPAFAAVMFLILMLWVVVGVLKEVKPALLYVIAFVLFGGGQVIFFLASEPLCNASNRKINGAFLTTLLNSAAIGAIYTAWTSITEKDWGEEYDGY